MLTPLEYKVLKIVGDHQLLSKLELKKAMNGISSSVLETTTQDLAKKKMIAAINPIGYTCFVITQQGARALTD